MDRTGTQTRYEARYFEPADRARAGWKRNRRVELFEEPSNAAHETGDVKRIDACLYLQTMCKLVQTAAPDCEAMECTVEDHGVGMVEEGICRMLALVLSELIRCAAACLPFDGIQPKLRIALRRRGNIVLCAIESRWLTRSGSCAPSGIHQTQQMIAALGASCMLRLMPERDLIAIMLDVSKAEPRIANAIAPYRLARVAHRPFAPEAMEWAYHA